MTPTEIIWRDLYDQAVQAFGGTTPGQQLETQILQHFTRHPAAVQAAIHKLADRYAQGKIHTPWPLVLTELQREDTRDHITATIDRERDQATHLAEIYITNAGLYIPTEADVLDDTFGPHGRLRQWADDQALRDRIVDHWSNQHDRAERSETAARAHTDAINASREAQPDDELAEQRAWIDNTGYAEPDFDEALRAAFPDTPTASIPTLRTQAAERLKSELGR